MSLKVAELPAILAGLDGAFIPTAEFGQHVGIERYQSEKLGLMHKVNRIPMARKVA